MSALPSNFVIDIPDAELDALIAARLAQMTPPAGWGNGSGGGTSGVRNYKDASFNPAGPFTWVSGGNYDTMKSVGMSLAALTVPSGGRVRIDCSGVAGHTDNGTIIQFSVFRGTTLVKPIISGVRPTTPDQFYPFAFTVIDEPPAGDHVYGLAIKTFGGSAYLGRRADGTNMSAPTFLMAEVL